MALWTEGAPHLPSRRSSASVGGQAQFHNARPNVSKSDDMQPQRNKATWLKVIPFSYRLLPRLPLTHLQFISDLLISSALTKHINPRNQTSGSHVMLGAVPSSCCRKQELQERMVRGRRGRAPPPLPLPL